MSELSQFPAASPGSAVLAESSPRIHQKAYLAIDLGGQSVRARVYDQDGVLICASQQALELGLKGLRCELNAFDFALALFRCLLEVFEELECRPQLQLCSAGLAVQRSSLIMVDASTGHALTPIISWLDRRAEAELQLRLSEQENLAAEIQEITGLVPNAHYGASKVASLLGYEGKLQDAELAGHLKILPLSSWLVSILSTDGRGPWYCDVVTAQRTLLMDVQRAVWSPAIMNTFDVPPLCLPQLKANKAHYGQLSLVLLFNWLRQNGLDEDYLSTVRINAGKEAPNSLSLLQNRVSSLASVPLALVTGDQNAALFASGPIQPGRLYLTLGTGAFAQAAITTALSHRNGLLLSVLNQGHAPVFGLEACINGCGSALNQLVEHIGCIDWDSISAAWRLGESRGMFFNGVGGLGSPYWQAQCPIAYLENDKERQPIEHLLDLSADDYLLCPKPESWAAYLVARLGPDKAARDLVIALLESVLFLIRKNLDCFERAGITLREIEVGGGLSRFDLFCQYLADISGLPVRRVAQNESSSLGLARMLACFPDKFADQEQGSQCFKSRTECQKAGTEAYHRWITLLENLVTL
jgi:glycerol kinase